jgi:hypothetical protein
LIFKVAAVDKVVGYLMGKLGANGLIDKLNILVVSDHGMADMTNNINLDTYVNMSLIDYGKTNYGIVSNIYPYKPANVIICFSLKVVN